MKISIAMATYNGAKYLQEQLDSFVAQTRLPDELVVCDDGSSDGSIEILEKFKRCAPFVVYIHKNPSNLGYARNFERSLSLCTGDVIFLSDQDDVWFPEKIKNIEQHFLLNHSVMVIIHDAKLTDDRLVWHGATKRDQVRRGWGGDDLFVTGALTALRKVFLECVLPMSNGASGHDGWIHGLARLCGCRLVLDDVLQLLRRHSSNTSDSIASSLRPITGLELVRGWREKKPAASYQDRLNFNDALTARFENRAAFQGLGIDSCRIDEIVNCLSRERKAIVGRQGLLVQSWLGKRLSALNMLFRGDYRYFNGFRSFVRDFTR